MLILCTNFQTFVFMCLSNTETVEALCIVSVSCDLRPQSPLLQPDRGNSASSGASSLAAATLTSSHVAPSSKAAMPT